MTKIGELIRKCRLQSNLAQAQLSEGICSRSQQGEYESVTKWLHRADSIEKMRPLESNPDCTAQTYIVKQRPRHKVGLQWDAPAMLN